MPRHPIYPPRYQLATNRPEDTATTQALKAFDRFLQQWTPDAVHEYLFSHQRNPADHVRNAIRGITDQRTLQLHPPPLGYAVLSAEPIHSRDYPDGLLYTPASPIFAKAAQGENSLDGFRRRRQGHFVLAEISEYRTRRADLPM